jgi:hypothetical protein
VSKWRPFSFIFNLGNTEVMGGQVRCIEWLGDDNHVVFAQKSPCWKENMRWCIVMQQPDLLSPKFGAKSSHIFMQSL